MNRPKLRRQQRTRLDPAMGWLWQRQESGIRLRGENETESSASSADNNGGENGESSPQLLHLRDMPITVRYPTIRGFILHWDGTALEKSWFKVSVYAAYVTAVAVPVLVKCSIKPDLPLCNLKLGNIQVEMIFALWMTFSAFLFTSFVRAGIARFDDTVGYVRAIEYGLANISWMLNSYTADAAVATSPASVDETLKTASRFLTAMSFVMYDANAFSGRKDNGFLKHTRNILTEGEYTELLNLRPDHRTYALMQWILKLSQAASEAGHVTDDVPGMVSGAIGTLRETYAKLVDSLDDAILPFAFANLIIVNVYAVLVALPWVMVGDLEYYVIPGAVIYMWFLDGMITFVFMVDRPFTEIYGKQCKQPMINLHALIAETNDIITNRPASIRGSLPKSVLLSPSGDAAT